MASAIPWTGSAAAVPWAPADGALADVATSAAGPFPAAPAGPGNVSDPLERVARPNTRRQSGHVTSVMLRRQQIRPRRGFGSGKWSAPQASSCQPSGRQWISSDCTSVRSLVHPYRRQVDGRWVRVAVPRAVPGARAVVDYGAGLDFGQGLGQLAPQAPACLDQPGGGQQPRGERGTAVGRARGYTGAVLDQLVVLIQVAAQFEGADLGRGHRAAAEQRGHSVMAPDTRCSASPARGRPQRMAPANSPS